MVFRPDKLGLRQEGIKKIFYRNGFEQPIQVLALAFCMSYDFVNYVIPGMMTKQRS